MSDNVEKLKSRVLAVAKQVTDVRRFIRSGDIGLEVEEETLRYLDKAVEEYDLAQFEADGGAANLLKKIEEHCKTSDYQEFIERHRPLR